MVVRIMATNTRSGFRVIKEELINLKSYLIEKKSWLSFKLMILGVAFYESGLYTTYQNYGTYFELSGIIFFIIGLVKLPLAKQLWEWIDK